MGRSPPELDLATAHAPPEDVKPDYIEKSLDAAEAAKAAAESISQEVRREPAVACNAFEAWSCEATLQEARDTCGAADEVCWGLKARTLTWQPTSEACRKAALNVSRTLVALVAASVRISERLGGSPRRLREHCERQIDEVLGRVVYLVGELQRARVAIEASPIFDAVDAARQVLEYYECARRRCLLRPGTQALVLGDFRTADADTRRRVVALKGQVGRIAAVNEDGSINIAFQKIVMDRSHWTLHRVTMDVFNKLEARVSPADAAMEAVGPLPSLTVGEPLPSPGQVESQGPPLPGALQ